MTGRGAHAYFLLIKFHPGALHDFGPFDRFLPDVHGELFGSTADDLDAESGKLFPDGRRCQRLVRFRIEPVGCGLQVGGKWTNGR